MIRKSFLRASLLSTGLAIVAATGTLISPTSPVRAAWQQDSPKAVLDEAWQIVNREYVDGSFNKNDWQAVRTSLITPDYNTKEQAYGALRKALKLLEDPYTRFMDAKQFESLTSQTSGDLEGVGIRLEADAKTKVLTVVEPLPNSPASRADIRSNDKVLFIDGRTTNGMSVEDASSLIRGKGGTPITLKIERDGKLINFPLIRAKIELKAVRYSVAQEGSTRVGFMRMSEFSSHAADQMRQAIKILQKDKVDGFVLDLRGNPGGLLQSSIEISRMWMDEGGIVKTVNRKGGTDELVANRTAISDLPLVVLVDKNSASSSEILTGALKDNKRATIIGTQTFGKALVQSVHPLSDGSGLAVTIAHYYTPNGTDISQKGIQPDVVLPLSREQLEKLYSNPRLLGTLDDPQYVRAVSTITKLISQRNLGQKPTTT
ncbi:MAG: PDZ domain-containing protein, partial [Alkalinema sp. CAN_BIN05]|nr:PDZ domain-containing protein [Alkalinema sp. CAN_BIN05]